MRIAKAILEALRGLRLTWLEAAVLHYYHFNGFHLYELPGLLGRRPSEIAEARRTLVRKAAAALGYIDHDEGLGPLTVPLPMPIEERTRLVDELLRQGLGWKEIGRRLGVKPDTLWKYHKKRKLSATV